MVNFTGSNERFLAMTFLGEHFLDVNVSGATMSPEASGGTGPTTPEVLPNDMVFGEDNLMSVIAYCVLFFIAAVGNLTVFITLFRNRQRRSRVNLFIMHLSVADLFVALIMMPLEIVWHITVSWMAGDAGCRIFMFFRAFGFYLSSFILVTISLDRYFAIARPLSLNDADRRGKLMLIFAWLFSIMASIPQSVIFHVEVHPEYAWFSQCVTFNFFPSRNHELAYNLFNIISVYVFPLVVIIVSYSLILVEMSRKTRESRDQVSVYRNNGTALTRRKRERREDDFRRSGIGRIEKARLRTLKMTIVIVSVFIVCWTPYFVMSAWWWFDQKTADTINNKVQKGLFLFAVSNSCVDPIVYGFFALDLTNEIRRCCCRDKARYALSRKNFAPVKRHPTPSAETPERKAIHAKTYGGYSKCPLIEVQDETGHLTKDCPWTNVQDHPNNSHDLTTGTSYGAVDVKAACSVSTLGARQGMHSSNTVIEPSDGR